MEVLHVAPDAKDDGRVAEALPACVESVAGATAALSRLDDRDVDCVVTELALDDGDGLDLVAAVDEQAPAVPVVVYTAAGSEELAGDAVAAGADGYVAKPDLETLAERVEDLVADGAVDVSGSELVVEQAPLGVIEWDREFRAVTWNPAAEELFGYDRETALGRTAWELVVPESARETVEEVWSNLRAGEGGHYSVNENVRADGSRLTCEWHNVPRVDEDGEVVGVLAFVRDVTDRTRRARALEALHDSTTAMFRAETPDAVAGEAVSAAEGVLDRALAAVYLGEPDEGGLAVAAMNDAGRERLADAGVDPETVPSALSDAFDAGERLLLDECGSGALYGAAVGAESGVVEPLGDHGVMIVAAPGTDAFDDELAHLARALAATTTAALDNAERQRELQRYRTTVEAAGDGVFTLDEDGCYVQVNDRFVDITGYDREELLGSHPEMLLAEEDVERARDQIRRLLGGEDVVSYELTLVRADGREVPCEVSQSLLPGDRFRGTVGTTRVVAERKRMERALRERKRKIEALHDVASRLDDCETRDGVAELAVDAAESILEFDECAVRLHHDGQLVLAGSSTEEPPDSRADDEGIVGRVFQTGETVCVEDLRDHDAPDAAGRAPGSDGHSFRSTLGVPLGEEGVLIAVSRQPGAFDEDDAELAELLGSHVTDALQRLSVAAELRAERDRLAALFENVPDPVVTATHADAGPVVEAVNPAFEETFGYDAAEVAGRHLDDLVVPDEQRSEATGINERAARGEIVEREVRRRTADGLRDFRLTVVPVDLEDGDPTTYGVYTDVTERKQRRKRVEVLNRVLRHDLRNEMTIVCGQAEQLAARLGGSDAEAARDIIERSDDLLSLAERTRAIERSLDREATTVGTVDLAAVVESVAAGLRERFPDADVAVDAPHSAPVVGEELLELAVEDAMENAVVHSDCETPRVEVTVAREGEDVVVRVADDGPGIPERERELLTGEEEITQLRHGSGLGLWLVHWAVTHSGGDLTIEDRDPRGSVVTMRLPAATGTAVPQPDSA